MKHFLLLTICFTLSVRALAGWVVDPEGSYVGFASVKNDLIAENHSFTEVSGSIDDSGDATILVTLASVDTMIPIRDERMQAILFKVGQFPYATVTSKIDLGAFTSMMEGENKTDTLSLTVNLHGTELTRNVLVKVTRSASQTYEVTSLGPIVVHASQFALSDGIESLRKVAGLQSIDLMVPVTFDLTLVRQQADN